MSIYAMTLLVCRLFATFAASNFKNKQLPDFNLVFQAVIDLMCHNNYENNYHFYTIRLA